MNKLVACANHVRPTPALGVDFALAGAWTDAAGGLAWTAAGDFCEGLTATRGRSYQIDQSQAGTARLTMRNTGSRFDPDNTAGPYYGQLLEGTPVRARMVHDGVIDGVTYGFADSFVQTLGDGHRPMMTVGLVDGWSVLAALDLPGSWPSLLTGIGVNSWLRLGENAETFTNTGYDAGLGTGYVSTTAKIVRVGGPDLVSSDVPGLVTSADGAVTLYAPVSTAAGVGVSIAAPIGGDPAGSHRGIGGAGGPLGTGQSTVGVLYRVNAQPADGSHAWVMVGSNSLLDAVIDPANGADALLTSGSSINYLGVRVDFHNAGNTYMLMGHDGSNTFAVTATVGPTAGTTDLVAVSLVNVGSALRWALNVNGARVALLPGIITLVAPRMVLGLTGTTLAPFTHTLDEFFTTSVLTDDQMTTLYAQYLTAIDLPQQLTGARVNALLDAIGWPTAMRDIDTGTIQVAALTDPTGVTAAAQLQACADLELGDVYVNRDGWMCFRDAARNSGGDVQAVFGENTGENHYEDDITVTRDRQRVVNDWTVSQDGGTSVTVIDMTSIRRNGHRSQSRSLPFANSADATAQATTLLAWTKNAHARVEQVTVRGEANPANLAQIGGRDLSDLVRVRRRTPSGSTIDIPSTVEGLTVTVTGGLTEISAKFQLDPYQGTPIGESSGFGTGVYGTGGFGGGS